MTWNQSTSFKRAMDWNIIFVRFKNILFTPPFILPFPSKLKARGLPHGATNNIRGGANYYVSSIYIVISKPNSLIFSVKRIWTTFIIFQSLSFTGKRPLEYVVFKKLIKFQIYFYKILEVRCNELFQQKVQEPEIIPFEKS